MGFRQKYVIIKIFTNYGNCLLLILIFILLYWIRVIPYYKNQFSFIDDENHDDAERIPHGGTHETVEDAGIDLPGI